MLGPARSGAVACLTAFFGFSIATAVWVDREAVVMGVRLKVEVEAETEVDADRVMDRVFASVAALDQTWTTPGPDSELNEVRSAELGTPVHLSDGTFDILARAWHLADRTDGAFEPAVGPLREAWAIAATKGPDTGQIEDALASVGRRCFDLSPATRTLARYCPNAWIDGAGFGRGAALASIHEILDAEGVERARIDFGGQLLLRGDGPIPGAASGVILSSPSDPAREVFEWLVYDGSFATVSQAGGEGTSVVVDPRDGSAVEPWGSVTVRSEDPLEADALATALFVMGPRDGIRWLAARPEVEAVFLVMSADETVACGRKAILDDLIELTPEGRISVAPLLSPTLRTCPT